MKIYVDADASPKAVKELLYRAADRERIPLILVSNQMMRIPESPFVSLTEVAAGPDEADDRIAGLAEAGDLVVTADIPLANRVVDKGAYAIDPRGAMYTSANIKDRLATRDLLDQLRSTGMNTGGPSPFNQKDRQAFADSLSKFLTRYHKS